MLVGLSGEVLAWHQDLANLLHQRDDDAGDLGRKLPVLVREHDASGERAHAVAHTRHRRRPPVFGGDHLSCTPLACRRPAFNLGATGVARHTE